MYIKVTDQVTVYRPSFSSFENVFIFNTTRGWLRPKTISVLHYNAV